MSRALTKLMGLKQKVQQDDSHEGFKTLQLELPTPTSVDVEFSDITFSATVGLNRKNKKTILKGVSGVFKSGQVTAIMGPSGAGKSSLMNTLTGFSTQGVTGTIRSGNTVCDLSKSNSYKTLKSYTKQCCYILQDDQLNPLFTVRELMKFAVDVKLGTTLTEKLKYSVINEVLQTLGLVGSENTRCSSLSGGQRKRLSIAVELIDNPPILFLDEPTTGLDSLTSLQCIQLLKNLAKNGRTIVCTIHQPTASVYSMFDQVYVLADGMCIYHGSSENTIPYLASFGLQCPQYHNPADYILEIANGEHGRFNEMLGQNCSKRDWCKPELPPAPAHSPDKVDGFSCGLSTILIRPPHELYKLKVLMQRSFTQQYRDWTVTHLKFLMHVVIGVLLGMFYDNAGNDGSKSVNNMGFLMISAVYLTYTSIMPAVFRFPSELPVIKKENFNNWYNLKTYYAAVLLTGIPVQILFSVVYSLPSYYLTGQPPEMFRFGMFVLVLANTTMLAEAVGNIIGTCANPLNGTFFGAVLTCFMIVFAGFLILLTHMSSPMLIVSKISFLKYVFEALSLSVYAFGRKPLPCPEYKEYCQFTYPKELLREFSFLQENYWKNIGILLCQVVVLRIVAFLTLNRSIKASR